ncbi:MAG: hypothetical protein HN576_15735 [Bacteriovoracaceae bacterium]|jgi:hypothetical protein|nr:hypothetical protein [Bacteriovoracaceae bacterium]
MKILSARAQALENIFFNEQDQELTELISKQKDERDQIFALRSLSGISNKSVLDNAVKLGMNATTFSALCLIPLLKVAWSDHNCDQKESHVILEFAAENGIEVDSAPYKLLQSWLSKEINSNLFIIWKEYVHSLEETLTQVELNEIKNEIIGRAIAVARASGGILGIGSISDVEKKVLNELEVFFEQK